MNKGFTLIEALFTLTISIMIIMIVTINTGQIKQLTIQPSEYTDIVLASKQIAEELMTSSNVTVNMNSISYTKGLKTFTIQVKKNNLIKTPGYEVILYNVDDVSFDAYEMITMYVTRGENEYEEAIGVYCFEE